jgi:apolipoprotein N-acyltransferase
VTLIGIITRAARATTLAFGWQRACLAFLAGAVSALALAPVNAWPILFITFPVLVWLVDGSPAGRWGVAGAAAWAGWCFGFGYFFVGLYWIGHAFLVDAKTFGWLLPIAICGLPAYLAIYTALGLAAARLIWVRGPARILALASMLTIAEWLRGHLLTGFPWNTFGYALTEPLILAQSVSLVGIWGLTLLAIAICSSPAVLADGKADTPYPYRVPLVSCGILLALMGYGAVRLQAHPTDYVSGVKLRIMQPNLQQDDKFNYSAKERVMARYLSLSDRAAGPNSKGARDATHLIWPESAFPFFLTREPDVLAQIVAMLKPNTDLITGSVRAADATAGTRVTRAYNSLYVIDADGSIRGIYDKVHLVPFGEYLPFQNLLEKFGLRQLTRQIGGFLAGDRRHVMDLAGAPPMLPLICYEAILPAYVNHAFDFENHSNRDPLIKQYIALLETEGVKLVFTDDAIASLARLERVRLHPRGE